ncbi:GTP pyrophosphokinase [Kitasatospora sp. NPDC001574]
MSSIDDADPDVLAGPQGETFLPAAEDEVVSFDFEDHVAKSRLEYEKNYELYKEFADAVKSALKACLENAGINIHSIDGRAKSIDGFAQKAGKPSQSDPDSPRYKNPLTEITDLAGVRVITFFLGTINLVEEIIRSEFDVRESEDKSKSFEKDEKIGYQSYHFLIRFTQSRISLPEYAKFSGLTAEIQVRTILQHAWAEIQHDIQYKPAYALPVEIKRRFVALAGLLEIADREFQALEKRDRKLRQAAIQSVADNNFSNVELTPEALRAYLDKTYGPDGRMSPFSYTWTVGLLKDLGFQDLGELDSFISGYDQDGISRAIHGKLQGQVKRLEDVLMVAAGDEFIRRHPWVQGRDDSQTFTRIFNAHLDRARRAGFEVGRRNLPDSHGEKSSE